jgi:hypothetical protein
VFVFAVFWSRLSLCIAQPFGLRDEVVGFLKDQSAVAGVPMFYHKPGKLSRGGERFVFRVSFQFLGVLDGGAFRVDLPRYALYVVPSTIWLKFQRSG